MTEVSQLYDRKNHPDREKEIESLKTDIESFFMQERDHEQGRNFTSAVRHLIKYFEYAANVKQLTTQLSIKNNDNYGVRSNLASINRSIANLEADITYIKRTNSGFKSEYDFLFTKAKELSGLYSVNPQVKSSGIAEETTATFFKFCQKKFLNE